MSEWKEYKLGDISEFWYGKMPKKELLGKGEYVTFSGYRYQDAYPEYNCNEGDVILVARGVGGTGDVKIVKQRCYLTNLSIKLLLDNTIIDNKFFYYFFKKDNLRYLDSGSAQSQITITDLNNEIFIFPSLDEQKTIASVLCSLDDKIDLLHRQNATLEKMAETLFRQWFVKEAKEWEIGKLGDIVEFNYGKALKDEERTGKGYPVIGSSGVVGYHKDFLVKAPGIVTGRKGTLGVINYMFDNFYPIDTTFFISSKTGSETLFFEYFLLRICDLANMNSDSAVPGLNKNAAHAIEVQIPPKFLIDKFAEMVEPMFEKIKTNQSQIHTLTQLRDTLLPKLMSREVRVEI
jgi:type I restriction enzyme S subunit